VAIVVEDLTEKKILESRQRLLPHMVSRQSSSNQPG
jgi:hypothetical protein